MFAKSCHGMGIVQLISLGGCTAQFSFGVRFCVCVCVVVQERVLSFGLGVHPIVWEGFTFLVLSIHILCVWFGSPHFNHFLMQRTQHRILRSLNRSGETTKCP